MSDPPTSDPPVSAPVPPLLLLEQTLNEIQKSLRYYIQRLVNSAEDAHDIVQEAYVQAVQAAHRRKPPFIQVSSEERIEQIKQIRRWLFHVAQCQAVSFMRRKRVIDKRVSAGELAPDKHPRTATFEAWIVEGDALRAALDEISQEDVSLLLLKVLHGYSAMEIAQSLGLKYDAVRQRLSRTQRKVRDVYELQNRERDARDGEDM